MNVGFYPGLVRYVMVINNRSFICKRRFNQIWKSCWWEVQPALGWMIHSASEGEMQILCQQWMVQVRWQLQASTCSNSNLATDCNSAWLGSRGSVRQFKQESRMMLNVHLKIFNSQRWQQNEKTHRVENGCCISCIITYCIPLKE